MAADVLCAHQISPNEEKDYSIDVTQHLVDSTGTVVDSVNSVDWLVDPNDGTVTLYTPYVIGETIGVFVMSTVERMAYRITARVTTDSSPEPRVFEESALLCSVAKTGPDATSAVTWP